MALWMGVPVFISSERCLFSETVNSGKNAGTGEIQDVSHGSSALVGTLSGAGEHQGVERVLSNLNVENERLRELEKKYLTLQGVTSETGIGKYFKSGATKDIDSVAVHEVGNVSKTDGQSDAGDTSNEISEYTPLQYSKNFEDAVPQKEEVDASVEDGEERARMHNRLHRYLTGIEKETPPITIAECFYTLGEYEKALQGYKNIPQEAVTPYQYMWARYQIANCFRQLKKYDDALNEFQRFIDENPKSELIVQAKWYVDDIAWWKEWQEKNTLKNNKLLMLSDNSDNNE
ncbi:MAG: hypothetical protein HKUEN01_20450 [Candidatus Kuenenia stuttgartiensis]|uniref:tetratricopeptide repeat protein n=1 Tax=Candidatus Kuenenia sp. TaxID=2499824 RepID=UPI00208D5A6A|nr:MAG: hypothetical protein HKUEN01_20450 [Candidatus Kuenenia stuttgartiensis]